MIMGFFSLIVNTLNKMIQINAKQETAYVYDRRNGLKICPSCGSSVKINAIRCKYCDYYFKRYSKSKSKPSPVSVKREYSKIRRCPYCGNTINSRAVRCKYCKTMLKKY